MEDKIIEIFTYLVFVQIFFVYLQKFVFKMKFTSMYCGMVGFSGVDNFDIDKIRILLLSNMTRGIDSTGMYNNGAVTKDIGNAISFLANNKIVPEKLFFAHDRAATIGFKNKDNAHPFKIGNIVGQHNGTLKQFYTLANLVGLKHNDYDVDSEILLHGLDKLENYDVLKEFDGAAALIWVDKRKPNKLFCFRNSERPLYRGMIGENMYISSIEDSLKIIGCNGIKQFKENYVYVIENGVINIEESKTIKRKQVLPVIYKGANLPTPKSVTSPWIKRNTFYGSKDGFTEGVYYQIQKSKPEKGDEFSGRITVLNDFGKEITSYLNFFHKVDEISQHDFVVSMYDSDPLEKGKILFVRGLEGKEDVVLERVPFDSKIYTWNVKHVRKATDKEVSEMYQKNDRINYDKKKLQ